VRKYLRRYIEIPGRGLPGLVWRAAWAEPALSQAVKESELRRGEEVVLLGSSEGWPHGIEYAFYLLSALERSDFVCLGNAFGGDEEGDWNTRDSVSLGNLPLRVKQDGVSVSLLGHEVLHKGGTVSDINS